MKTKLWCAIIIGNLVAGSYVSADLITVSGASQVADTYLRSDSTGTSYVNDNYMLVGTLPNGTTTNNAVMKFDLSAYSGETVQDATLRLYFDKNWANQTADVTVQIHEISAANGDWDPAEATWGRRDLTPTWKGWVGATGCNLAGTDYATALVGSAVIVDGAAVGIVDFTLDASVIQKWIDNPSQNYGIILTAPGASAGSGVYFFSTQYASAPTLSINTVVPEPATIGMLGIGSLMVLGLRRRLK